MKTCFTIFALVVAAITGVGTRDQAGDRITTVAAVLDADGQPVSGLGAADFELRDKGKITSVQAVRQVGARSILVLADVSGSLMTRADQVIDGAAAVLRAIPAGDTVRFGTFATKPAISPVIAGSREPIIEDLRRRRPFGNASSLFEALSVAIEETKSDVGRRVIILISDGDDTSSRISERDVVDRAQTHDVAITSLVLERVLVRLPPLPSSRPSAMVQKIGFSKTPKTLAEETGGGYLPVSESSPGALEEAARRAIRQLEGEYILEFTPATGDGKRHRLEVRVTRPGLSVRVRRAFVAPRKG